MRVRVCPIADAHIRQNETTLYCASSSANISEGKTVRTHCALAHGWNDSAAAGVKHYIMSAIIHIRWRVYVRVCVPLRGNAYNREMF